MPHILGQCIQTPTAHDWSAARHHSGSFYLFPEDFWAILVYAITKLKHALLAHAFKSGKWHVSSGTQAWNFWLVVGDMFLLQFGD